MTKATPTIAWPAIIQYTVQAELVYIRNQAEWDADRHLHGFRHGKADILIDSDGAVYRLTDARNGSTMPESTGKTASLQQIIEMVRAHASQTGSCCVAKFSVASIREAIAAVNALG